MATFFNPWPLSTRACHLFYPQEPTIEETSPSCKEGSLCQKINSFSYGLFAGIITGTAKAIDAIFVEMPRYACSSAKVSRIITICSIAIQLIRIIGILLFRCVAHQFQPILNLFRTRQPSPVIEDAKSFSLQQDCHPSDPDCPIYAQLKSAFINSRSIEEKSALILELRPYPVAIFRFIALAMSIREKATDEADKESYDGLVIKILQTLSMSVFLECLPKWDANPDLREEDWKSVLLLSDRSYRHLLGSDVIEVSLALKKTNAAKTYAPPVRTRGTRDGK